MRSRLITVVTIVAAGMLVTSGCCWRRSCCAPPAAHPPLVPGPSGYAVPPPPPAGAPIVSQSPYTPLGPAVHVRPYPPTNPPAVGPWQPLPGAPNVTETRPMPLPPAGATLRPPIMPPAQPEPRPPAAAPNRIAEELPAGIPGYIIVQEGKVAAGLQPFSEAYAWLKSHGFRSVLHLRPTAEDNTAARTSVEKQGLRYLTLEVTPESLNRELVSEFIRLVRDTQLEPMFVYDRNGASAGALWYLHFRLAGNLPEAEAKAKAKLLGLKDESVAEAAAWWQAINKVLADK